MKKKKLMRGLFFDGKRKREFIVIGMAKIKDDSGFALSLINATHKDKTSRTIAKLFIPKGMATILAKFFLGKKLKVEPSKKKSKKSK